MKNNLIAYLCGVFGQERTFEAVERYYVGCSDTMAGSAIFWQIDQNYDIRTGKIMQYDCTTGKRIKDRGMSKINWVHSSIANFSLSQCLFGEHLLIDNTKPIAIVEAEKTAIIASIVKPNYSWLATGGAKGLTYDKCKVLKGRSVVVFADAGMYDSWCDKVKAFCDIGNFVVSDLVENIATPQQREDGYDIADYLIAEELERKARDTVILASIDTKPNVRSVQLKAKKGSWDSEIAELDHFFANTHIDDRPIKLSCCETVRDPRLMIEGGLRTIKCHNGNKTFRPYLDSLITLKSALTQQNQAV